MALSQAARDSPLDHSGDSPRLVGGRCADCASVMFPLRARCPSCASAAVQRILLPSRGALWTWTIQGFAPKAPPYVPEGDGEEFTPFGVGYVELAGNLRVETRLTEADPRRLRIGMEMELVALEQDGREYYAFAPVDDA